MDAIRQTLDGLLGAPKRKQAEDSVTMVYRADSEIPPIVPMKLKVEINTRDHFSVLGHKEQTFSIKSRWFSGTCRLNTYALEELLGTKLRALYQRRKGRDLFDLWLGLTLGKANPKTVVQTFRKYMNEEGLAVSRREFRENLAKKMNMKSFLADTNSLLRPGIAYQAQDAYHLVDEKVLQLL